MQLLLLQFYNLIYVRLQNFISPLSGQPSSSLDFDDQFSTRSWRLKQREVSWRLPVACHWLLVAISMTMLSGVAADDLNHNSHMGFASSHFCDGGWSDVRFLDLMLDVTADTTLNHDGRMIVVEGRDAMNLDCGLCRECGPLPFRLPMGACPFGHRCSSSLTVGADQRLRWSALALVFLNALQAHALLLLSCVVRWVDIGKIPFSHSWTQVFHEGCSLASAGAWQVLCRSSSVRKLQWYGSWFRDCGLRPFRLPMNVSFMPWRPKPDTIPIWCVAICMQTQAAFHCMCRTLCRVHGLTRGWIVVWPGPDKLPEYPWLLYKVLPFVFGYVWFMWGSSSYGARSDGELRWPLRCSRAYAGDDVLTCCLARFVALIPPMVDDRVDRECGPLPFRLLTLAFCMPWLSKPRTIVDWGYCLEYAVCRLVFACSPALGMGS